jgi:threonine dehydrogenase-like Zn-dependent dehydrogenase
MDRHHDAQPHPDRRAAPARANMRTVSLEEVPDGYRAMADRQGLKVLIRP